MSEWRVCKLLEITEPVKETYLPNNLEELNYIGLEHIEQETLRLNSLGKSSDITSNKFIFQKNDVLFGKLRPYFRKVCKPRFSGICSTDIWVFRAKKNISQDFLFYFLANWDFIDTANTGEGGTRMPRADWNFLKSTLWNIPTLSEQKAIAAVLSSLDDKIDLLHRQNKTLEAMAEALFKQWFVVEAREDWGEKPLNYFFEISSGKGLKKEQLIKNGIYPVLGANGEIGRTNNYLFDEKLLFTGRVGTLGNIFIVDNKKVWLSDNTLVFRKIQYFYFIYFVLKSSRLADYNAGSTQPLIRQSDIKEITIYFPCKEKLDFFENQSENFFRKIYSNNKQIQTLEALRDTLLPKLMSGQVRLTLP